MADLTTEQAEDILGRATENLARSSQITRFSAGAKARSLLGIMASETERMGDILSANMVLSLLNGASGVYLDFLGDLVGASRKPATAAEVSASSQIIRIFCPSGQTAGTMNRNTGIRIPGNTIIESLDGKYKFSTLATATISQDESEVYVAARSIAFGEDGNVAAGTLQNLDFTNYSSYPTISLGVENISSIESGSEEESDSFYRYRISTALLSAEAANRTAIRLAALSVPSITDLVILDLYRGIGTADLIIDSTFGTISDLTIRQAQVAIGQVAAVGMDIRIRSPRLVGLEVTIKPTYVTGTSATEKQRANTAIRGAIANLLSEVQLGGVLFINDIAFAAKEAHPAIADIGRPNRPLDDVVLWRDSALSGRAPLQLQANKNIELKTDQRLVFEGSLAEAIRILS